MVETVSVWQALPRRVYTSDEIVCIDFFEGAVRVDERAGCRWNSKQGLEREFGCGLSLNALSKSIMYRVNPNDGLDDIIGFELLHNLCFDIVAPRSNVCDQLVLACDEIFEQRLDVFAGICDSWLHPL